MFQNFTSLPFFNQPHITKHHILGSPLRPRIIMATVSLSRSLSIGESLTDGHAKSKTKKKNAIVQSQAKFDSVHPEGNLDVPRTMSAARLIDLQVTMLQVYGPSYQIASTTVSSMARQKGDEILYCSVIPAMPLAYENAAQLVYVLFAGTQAQSAADDCIRLLALSRLEGEAQGGQQQDISSTSSYCYREGSISIYDGQEWVHCPRRVRDLFQRPVEELRSVEITFETKTKVVCFAASEHADGGTTLIIESQHELAP